MKRSLKIIFSMVVLFILILSTTVQADSFNLNAVPSKQTVKAGETVDITLSLANINMGEFGINTVECYLEYDANIFENVTQSSFGGLNNWSITYNDEDTEEKGKVLAVIVQTGVTQNQDIAKLKLKVKENVQNTDTSVKIKNIKSNNGQVITNETDKTIDLKIVKKQTGEEQNGQNNNGADKNHQGSNKPTQNTSTGILPQTGVTDYIFVGVGIVILTIVTVSAYIKFKKIDK